MGRIQGTGQVDLGTDSFISLRERWTEVGDHMVDISDPAKKVLEALKKLSATSEDVLKTADDVMKACKMGKAQVNADLGELVSKGLAKRVARQKSAGYYLLKDKL